MKEKIVVNLIQAFNAAVDGTEGDVIKRYNGGWTKTVTGLDKSKDNGYSLIGEFVKSEQLANQAPGLYVDCDIAGSRKNQAKQYQLFELKPDGTAQYLAYSRGFDWAVKLWPAIDSWFAAEIAAEIAAEAANRSGESRKTEIQAEIKELENRIASLQLELAAL